MQPDFQRDVHCLLGLPFDAITEAQAEAAVRRSVRERIRCFLSTPNLNFAIGCLDDAGFRDSVLQSDMSIADGWPIVAVARLLRVQLPERVTGSGLFERLCASDQSAISVFFFGGPHGAAEAASNRLNAGGNGVRCAGFDAAGFGTVEQMSEPARLARLNDCRPDFVVVALGARKGQSWIQRNLHSIQAPVIGHLGAVVNFAAGTLMRAPRWVQAARLEWLWRIKEEPVLWRRYQRDGLAFLRLLFTRVVPHALDMRLNAPSADALAAARSSLLLENEHTVLRLEGAWTVRNASMLREQLQFAVARGHPIALDLGAATYVDSAVVGLLALLYGWHRRRGLSWSVNAPASLRVQRLVRWMSAEYLLQTN